MPRKIAIAGSDFMNSTPSPEDTCNAKSSRCSIQSPNGEDSIQYLPDYQNSIPRLCGEDSVMQ